MPTAGGHDHPEPAENIGCRCVQYEERANGEKWNTQFRDLNHEEREEVEGHEETTFIVSFDSSCLRGYIVTTILPRAWPASR